LTWECSSEATDSQSRRCPPTSGLAPTGATRAEMLLKIHAVSQELQGLPPPCTKDRHIENKGVGRSASRPGIAHQKDVKNEGASGNVFENKGNGEMAHDRSGWFDENTAVASEKCRRALFKPEGSSSARHPASLEPSADRDALRRTECPVWPTFLGRGHRQHVHAARSKITVHPAIFMKTKEAVTTNCHLEARGDSLVSRVRNGRRSAPQSNLVQTTAIKNEGVTGNVSRWQEPLGATLTAS
jgi:hypothetical protein